MITTSRSCCFFERSISNSTVNGEPARWSASSRPNSRCHCRQGSTGVDDGCDGLATHEVSKKKTRSRLIDRCVSHVSHLIRLDWRHCCRAEARDPPEAGGQG